MNKPKKSQESLRSGRLIHVRLPEDVHRRLKTKVAEQDTTIQNWVELLVSRELDSHSRKHSKD